MSRLRRALVVLCTLAAAWSVVVALTGGFVVHLGSIRVSSRSSWNSVLLALVLGAFALALPGGRRKLGEELSWWYGWLKWADPVAMIALVGTGWSIYQWARGLPLWLDEEMIALNVRDRPLVDLAGPLWLGQSAPFGWLAAQRAALLTLGTSEHALRLLPLLFGIATLAAAVWVGRRWIGRAGALVLILLCSIGQWLSAYFLELKHYSADTFWALLLPALAAWTVEAGEGRSTFETRRAAIWWVVAAVGQWFANGALLVTPACAGVVLVMVWRRNGWRAAMVFVLFGCVWVASFALHYHVAVRYTMNSEFLRSYWSHAMPPASSGLSGTLSWLAAQFEPFALKPGGTVLWLMFWVSAACGFALSTDRALGALFAMVPISAFALAALRVVPLSERVSLWVVPALYVGIALFSDSAVRLAREGYARRSWMRVVLAVVVAFVAFQVCSDIFRRGKEHAQAASSARSNHQLDDRAGVHWLMGQRQPGDVLMTTHLALPAIWWYGGIPMSSPDLPGSRQSDGSPILEVGYRFPGPECQRNQLRDTLKDARRVLVYFGFRFDDVPEGFDALLLDGLAELGIMRSFHNFAEVGRAAVIDLHPPPDAEQIVSAQTGTLPINRRARLSGCVDVRLASRW